MTVLIFCINSILTQSTSFISGFQNCITLDQLCVHFLHKFVLLADNIMFCNIVCYIFAGEWFAVFHSCTKVTCTRVDKSVKHVVMEGGSVLFQLHNQQWQQNVIFFGVCLCCVLHIIYIWNKHGYFLCGIVSKFQEGNY